MATTLVQTTLPLTCGFPSSHVGMWELDYKESWVPKNWCFWTVVLEKTLESPLDSNEIKPVNPKGNQSQIFGRTDAEGETPIFGHLIWRTDSLGKDPDAGNNWRWEQKGMTEDEMIGWHHWLNGYESEQAPGVGDGQGSLTCCSLWSCKESDNRATQLDWTETFFQLYVHQKVYINLNFNHYFKVLGIF